MYAHTLKDCIRASIPQLSRGDSFTSAMVKSAHYVAKVMFYFGMTIQDEDFLHRGSRAKAQKVA